MPPRPTSSGSRTRNGSRRGWTGSGSATTYSACRRRDEWSSSRRSRRSTPCRASINKIYSIKKRLRRTRGTAWSRRIRCMRVYRMSTWGIRKRGGSSSLIILGSTRRIMTWKPKHSRISSGMILPHWQKGMKLSIWKRWLRRKSKRRERRLKITEISKGPSPTPRMGWPFKFMRERPSAAWKNSKISSLLRT